MHACPRCEGLCDCDDYHFDRCGHLCLQLADDVIDDGITEGFDAWFAEHAESYIVNCDYALGLEAHRDLLREAWDAALLWERRA